ncbi:unnamed protein product [Psylliodes chrysocephalus]|uniref:dolichol kinase n=1 Tax=Psylliodes chrysocephalus TaxID=3402493 RepID=A0A9P0DA25_9CUCU|nr:unnamed protein product [Psylliodes chrysocephala]
MSVDDFLLKNDFQLRAGSRSGLWMLFLLPLSIIISAFKHSITTTPTYKLASLICTGMVLVSFTIILQRNKNQKLNLLNIWNIGALIVTSVLFHMCFQRGWLFCIFGGSFSTLAYLNFYKFILTKFKECFSLGEAGFVSQGLTLFSFFTISNVLNHSLRIVPFRSNMQISTLILQLGLTGIGIIAFSCYCFKIKSTVAFYSTSILAILSTIIIPLHILLQRSPVLWIVNQMFDDWSTIKLIMYWIFCTCIAVLAVSNQIFYAKKASTITRKIFHALAVAVYIPGLLYRCSFLYLASGVVLGIFFALEILRNLRIPPLGIYLQDGFVVFSDEKDCEQLALTPIYLLAGCSLPIWIHPSPCDVTDSASFNLVILLSGLLSIGVGDSMASIVGSHYGKFSWPGTKKTVEGTLACVLSQVGLIYLLIYFDCIRPLSSYDSVKILSAIVVTSLVEAKTTQVDNLALPLVMYIILIL